MLGCASCRAGPRYRVAWKAPLEARACVLAGLAGLAGAGGVPGPQAALTIWMLGVEVDRAEARGPTTYLPCPP